MWARLRTHPYPTKRHSHDHGPRDHYSERCRSGRDCIGCTCYLAAVVQLHLAGISQVVETCAIELHRGAAKRYRTITAETPRGSSGNRAMNAQPSEQSGPKLKPAITSTWSFRRKRCQAYGIRS